MTERVHEVIGWRFRGGGHTNPEGQWKAAIYVVTRWQRGAGYWVRLVEGRDHDRQVGDTACISERAIGRTYHRIWRGPNFAAEPHEQPCECWVCEGRDP